jgi:hypothetical protein
VRHVPDLSPVPAVRYLQHLGRAAGPAVIAFLFAVAAMPNGETRTWTLVISACVLAAGVGAELLWLRLPRQQSPSRPAEDE